MAVRRKVRKLHEFFEEEAMRTRRPRQAIGLVQALEEFTLAQKQRLEQDLAQQTLERLRVVKEDVERRRAARRPSPRRPSARARVQAEMKAEAEEEAAVEKAEGVDAVAEEGNNLSPARSLSCLSDDSADIWCSPLEPTVLPGNLRPLEDLSRDDLARIYSKESYMERRRLFKEACRKRFGRHVWTWEHLMGYEPRSLADTCSVPPVDSSERQRLNRREVSPSKMQGLIRQVHKDLEDEEKELELKFLELEMKMNPHVAEEGLYDYQPEVIAELQDAICSMQRSPRLNVRRRRKRSKRVWNPIPKATMMRAKERAMMNAASSNEDSDSETEPKRLKDLLLYDSKNKCFLPPQALLQRAKVHERLAEDRRLIEELEMESKTSIIRKVSPVRCTKTVVAAVGNTKPRKIRLGGGDASNKRTGRKKTSGKKNVGRSSKTSGVIAKSDEIPSRSLDRGDALTDADETPNDTSIFQSEHCPSADNGENADFSVEITSNNGKPVPPVETTENETPFSLTERELQEILRSVSPTSGRSHPLSRMVESTEEKMSSPSCSAERDPPDPEDLRVTSPALDLSRPSSRSESTETRIPSSSSAERDPPEVLRITSSNSDFSRPFSRMFGSTESHTPSSYSAERDPAELLRITSPTSDLSGIFSRMFRSRESRTPSCSSAEGDPMDALRIMSPTSGLPQPPPSVIGCPGTPIPSSPSRRNDLTEVLPIASPISSSVCRPTCFPESNNLTSSEEEDPLEFLRNIFPVVNAQSKVIDSPAGTRTCTRTPPTSLSERETSKAELITSVVVRPLSKIINVPGVLISSPCTTKTTGDYQHGSPSTGLGTPPSNSTNPAFLTQLNPALTASPKEEPEMFLHCTSSPTIDSVYTAPVLDSSEIPLPSSFSVTINTSEVLATTPPSFGVPTSPSKMIESTETPGSGSTARMKSAGVLRSTSPTSVFVPPASTKTRTRPHSSYNKVPPHYVRNTSRASGLIHPSVCSAEASTSPISLSKKEVSKVTHNRSSPTSNKIRPDVKMTNTTKTPASSSSSKNELSNIHVLPAPISLVRSSPKIQTTEV